MNVVPWSWASGCDSLGSLSMATNKGLSKARKGPGQKPGLLFLKEHPNVQKERGYSGQGDPATLQPPESVILKPKKGTAKPGSRHQKCHSPVLHPVATN